jgi:hypothetical protein
MADGAVKAASTTVDAVKKRVVRDPNVQKPAMNAPLVPATRSPFLPII